MKRWPYDQKMVTQREIELAIADPVWQAYRITMKGKPTEAKLDMLDAWLE